MNERFTISQTRQLHRLAAAILDGQAALLRPPSERPPDTADLVAGGIRALLARYGRAGAAVAARSWCDTVAAAIPPGHHIEHTDQPDVADLTTRWTAPLIGAVHSGDQVQIYRLLDVVINGLYLHRLSRDAATALDVLRERPAAALAGVPLWPGAHLRPPAASRAS